MVSCAAACRGLERQAVPFGALPRRALPCRAVLCRALPRRAVATAPGRAAPYRAAPCMSRLHVHDARHTRQMYVPERCAEPESHRFVCH